MGRITFSRRKNYIFNIVSVLNIKITLFDSFSNKFTNFDEPKIKISHKAEIMMYFFGKKILYSSKEKIPLKNVSNNPFLAAK